MKFNGRRAMQIPQSAKNIGPTRRGMLIAGATAPLWLGDLARSVAQENQGARSSPPPRRNRIVLTIVYDNNPGPKNLVTQWGFSCLVQGTEKTVLFDTGGDGEVLLRNMHRMGLDPRRIDTVVLSHIHGDHTGGLPSIVRDRPHMPVYIPTGFPATFIDHARSLGAEVIEADETARICSGVRTTGTLGKGAIEEHGLCVETDKGGVLITGCAHPGADNMAAQARQVTGQAVHLVVGGYHMVRQPESSINAVIDRFEKLGVQRAAPCHCSGDLTRKLFKQRLVGRCSLVGAGDLFRFKAPAANA
jgi:7,8-dihydropterin-6-yl-methyl-4-(beta-D-ribofuranosyl)aminobenzene 5'-phosphate synthase